MFGDPKRMKKLSKDVNEKAKVREAETDKTEISRSKENRARFLSLTFSSSSSVLMAKPRNIGEAERGRES